MPPRTVRRVATTLLVAAACSGRAAPAPVPPVGSDGPDAAVAEVPCTEPRPTADATCVQDCGPPVVRDTDPPPAWRWLSPEEVASRAQHGCPRCLPADAAIATPGGDVAVSALTAGMTVWSLDAGGRRVAVPVVRVGSVPSPRHHTLVVLDLADGREVTASAGHPTGDGRALGTLGVADPLDGSRVIAVRQRPYGGERTFDLVPASPTRAYWADGVLLTSTLR